MYFFFTKELKHNNAVLLAFRRVCEAFSTGNTRVFFDDNYLGYIDFIKIMKEGKATHVVAPTMFSVIILKLLCLFNGLKVVYWVQGDVPSESMLKNNSKTRFYILSLVEYIALILSDSCIYVSPYMKEYYDSKVKRKSVVLPCISTLRVQPIVSREPSSYCYIGGMSKWQKIDSMLIYMNVIFRKDSFATLKIATREQALAREKVEKFLDKKFLENVTVVTLESEKDTELFLSRAEFGFLLRDDIRVNHVASPIKLAEYLSCGVNVLISPSIKSYAPLIEKYGAGKVVYDNEPIVPIEYNESASIFLYNLMFSKCSVTDILQEFE